LHRLRLPDITFIANIRNPNARSAYARACRQFFAWCDERGLALMTVRPVASRATSKPVSGRFQRRM
jgi:hypothetical protein